MTVVDEPVENISLNVGWGHHGLLLSMCQHLPRAEMSQFPTSQKKQTTPNPLGSKNAMGGEVCEWLAGEG